MRVPSDPGSGDEGDSDPCLTQAKEWDTIWKNQTKKELGVCLKE
jgi:hypothetical protein